MPRYCSLEQVRLRLVGKVRFDETGDDENKMSHSLANLLIGEAEGQVELDLSPRYSSPFQTDGGGAFSALPSNTQQVLKTLAELQSVIRILETDFGRGTIVDADKYIEKLQKRYAATVEQLLKTKGDDYRNWVYPPLPGLQLNYHNTTADDGFSGSILSTSENDGDFPAKRINDPSENFWNATLET